MLEQYLDIITNMENYIDGIIVLDTDVKIVYIRQFNPNLTPLDEKKAIGKSLFDIYPNLDPRDSTIVKALHEGKTTLHHLGSLTTADGVTFQVEDDTFPIKENDQIIGAVCITNSPTKRQAYTSLELNTSSSSKANELYTMSDIIGRSEAVQSMRSQIQRVSQTSSSVLIYGATGTGKEMIAQSIHTASNRKNKPFLVQNCAAIPATLLESIFFGTVKGSYTGAENRPGLFESADGGTVFLDEINSMDVGLQAKLLRILEEKKVSRIGSTDSCSVDVRIIAAMNKPPVECMNDGSLRPDLFYRLGSVTIDVPELKDRGNDIQLLCEYFVSVYNTKIKKDIIGVSQDVMTIFRNYTWPGNIREFKNVIEGAFNLCDSPVIGIGDLPSYMLTNMNLNEIVADNQADLEDLQWLGSLKSNVDAYEKSLIIKAIKSQPSLSAAANYLGISRQSLNQKINKYKIPVGHHIIRFEN